MYDFLISLKEFLCAISGFSIFITLWLGMKILSRPFTDEQRRKMWSMRAKDSMEIFPLYFRFKEYPLNIVGWFVIILSPFLSLPLLDYCH